MSSIDFKTVNGKSSFLDPRKGFEENTEEFQIRFDPLTGRSGRLSHFGAIRPQKLLLSDYERTGTKGCPFCPELRGKITPQFPREVLSEGRLIKGEAALIPNLYPYDAHSGIIIMTDDHVVPLEKLTEKRLSDSLSLGVDFLKRLSALDPSLPYHLMAWNYMPPSGGGLVHPHQQCFATRHPGNQYMGELEASNRFHDAFKANYWQDYINEERRRGERYIGRIGASHWLSSFVPLGLLGDVVCVFPEVVCVDDFTDGHVADLIAGIRRLFAYYDKEGICSFNASLLFGPANQKHFSCHFRIVPRTFLNTRDFAPDINFYQVLFDESVSVVVPEHLCSDLLPYFSDKRSGKT
jgi:UDPglucose--hexose-1-phosphate uridylyltransferase